MYSVKNKLLDSFFLEMFQKTNDRHTQCMQQATRNDFVIPKRRLHTVRQSIRYVGTITWNTIPSSIRIQKQKPYLAKDFPSIFNRNTNFITCQQCTMYNFCPTPKTTVSTILFFPSLHPSLSFLSFFFHINNVLHIFVAKKLSRRYDANKLHNT